MRRLAILALAITFGLLSIGAESCDTTEGGGGDKTNQRDNKNKNKTADQGNRPDVKTKPDQTTPPPPPPPPDCDPNYSGCLDPNASDYDCEGGSGDGPEYTGYVTVVGSDPHGLDSDGDGQACE